MKVELVFDNLIIDRYTLQLAKLHNMEIVNIGANGPYLHVQFRGREFELHDFVHHVTQTNENFDQIHYDGKGGLFSS